MAVIARPLVLLLLTEKWAEFDTLFAIVMLSRDPVSCPRDQPNLIASIRQVRSVSSSRSAQKGSYHTGYRYYMAVGYYRDDLWYDRRIIHFLLFKQLLRRASHRLSDI